MKRILVETVERERERELYFRKITLKVINLVSLLVIYKL